MTFSSKTSRQKHGHGEISGQIFISFEGIDGAGKSTHIEALAGALRAQGRAVLCTREPGGTPLAEQLRELVLHEPMQPLTEALLMFAARREHVARVIAPALAAGQAVLCDRFADATFAYQGGGRGLDWGMLQALEQMALDGRGLNSADSLVQPNLTLWFDLPPQTAAARLTGVRLPDRFEAQPVAFFEAVRAAYARRMREAPARIVRIDADQAPQAVWGDVWSAVQSHMEQRA